MKRLSTSSTVLLAAAVAALVAWRGGERAGNAAPPLRLAKRTTTAPTTIPTDERIADILIGDAALRGELDLSRAVERDGHLEIELSDGRHAVLTLDPAIQSAAEKVLQRARAPYGAVVVMTPDGRLLAYAGRANAEDKPHDFELPARVWAPAASVFKIVTAAALLDKGVEPETEVCFHGGIRSVDRSHLKDDPKRDRACADLAFGLAKSQNAIIGKLAHRHLDPETLTAVAEAFGFDRAPQFALAAEASRLELPADDDLGFARVAAGFWHSEMSPLSGALVANVVASGGLSVTPRIVASIRDADGDETAVVGVAPRRVIRADVAKRVAQMMVGTTDFGTAAKAFKDKRGRPFLRGVDVAASSKKCSKSRISRAPQASKSYCLLDFASNACGRSPHVALSPSFYWSCPRGGDLRGRQPRSRPKDPGPASRRAQ